MRRSSKSSTRARSYEREIRDRHGRWYELRILPYKTLESRTEGAVLAFVDVNDLHNSRALAESIIANVPSPFLVLRSDLRVLVASQSFYEFFKAAPYQTEGRFLYELGGGEWNIPELRRLLEEILPKAQTLDGYLVDHEFSGIGRKMMLLNARTLVHEASATPLMLFTIEDVTDRTRLESTLGMRIGELRRADRNKNEFIAMLGHELRNPLAPIRNAAEILKQSPVGPAADGAREMIDRQCSASRASSTICSMRRASRKARWSCARRSWSCPSSSSARPIWCADRSKPRNSACGCRRRRSGSSCWAIRFAWSRPSAI